MTAQEYIAKSFQAVEGWLWENAVYTTELFMVAQRDLGVEGINLETLSASGRQVRSHPAHDLLSEAARHTTFPSSRLSATETLSPKVSIGEVLIDQDT
jgi:hypothetical protein